MSSHALRLYVFAVTLLVFFVLWAVIAARPWASAAGTHSRDQRLVALERRQRRLENEARVIRQRLDRRWREYRRRLHRREARIRMLERRHAQQVAAARLAGASATYPSTGAVGSTGASAAQVVTLPPQVRVVTLPPAAAPATGSGSSHP